MNQPEVQLECVHGSFSISAALRDDACLNPAPEPAAEKCQGSQPEHLQADRRKNGLSGQYTGIDGKRRCKQRAKGQQRSQCAQQAGEEPERYELSREKAREGVKSPVDAVNFKGYQ